MIAFPNCKINLGLRILRKRSDNFHDLETLFYPLPFYDVLEVLPTNAAAFSLQSTGLGIDTPISDNLCTRAYQLLKKDFPSLPSFRAHLHKAIPSGAGLGGGSADAAFMLNLVNEIAGLNLSREQLNVYALQLGSDCPFFLLNQPALGEGRGERLTPFPLDLSAYSFVIVNPRIHVPTARAFSLVSPAVPDHSLRDTLAQPINEWKHELKNDFEEPVFNLYPAIRKIKDHLYEWGASYASLSGSGSTVYGIFKKGMKMPSSFPPDYFVRELNG